MRVALLHSIVVAGSRRGKLGIAPKPFKGFSNFCCWREA
jgi:hypothetical protein